jgi:hypothetical protein
MGLWRHDSWVGREVLRLNAIASRFLVEQTNISENEL